MKWQVLLDLMLDRYSARQSSLKIQTTESPKIVEVKTVEVEPDQTEQAECLSNMRTSTCSRGIEISPSGISQKLKVSSSNGYDSSIGLSPSPEAKIERSEDILITDVEATDIAKDISCSAAESSYLPISHAVEDLRDVDIGNSLEETSCCMQEPDDTDMARSGPSPGLPTDFSFLYKHSSVSMDYGHVEEDSEHKDAIKCKLLTDKDDAYYGNGYVNGNKSANPLEDAGTLFSGVGSFPTESNNGNGPKKVEISG